MILPSRKLLGAPRQFVSDYLYPTAVKQSATANVDFVNINDILTDSDTGTTVTLVSPNTTSENLFLQFDYSSLSPYLFIDGFYVSYKQRCSGVDPYNDVTIRYQFCNYDTEGLRGVDTSSGFSTGAGTYTSGTYNNAGMWATDYTVAELLAGGHGGLMLYIQHFHASRTYVPDIDYVAVRVIGHF